MGHVPFVVPLGEDRAKESDDRGAVGEDPDDVRSPPSSRLRRSCGLVDQICRQWSRGKWVKARSSARACARSAAASGEARAQFGDDPGMMAARRCGVRLGEDRADIVATNGCANFGTLVSR